MKAAIALLFSCALTACADRSGPPTPNPAQPVETAIARARSEMLLMADSAEATNFYSQCISWRISYAPPDVFWEEHRSWLGKTSPFTPRDRDWTWFITFIHPEGDFILVYRILRDGKAVQLVPTRRQPANQPPQPIAGKPGSG